MMSNMTSSMIDRQNPVLPVLFPEARTAIAPGLSVNWQNRRPFHGLNQLFDIVHPQGVLGFFEHVD